MTTFWPSAFSISAAVTRVTWSVEPPAAHGTMIVMGFVGFHVACASAGAAIAAERMAAAPAASQLRLLWFMALLLARFSSRRRVAGAHFRAGGRLAAASLLPLQPGRSLTG